MWTYKRGVWQGVITFTHFYWPLLANISISYLSSYWLDRANKTLDAVKGLSYTENKNWTEKGEKVEKKEWKIKLSPLFHYKKKDISLGQMGYFQLE